MFGFFKKKKRHEDVPFEVAPGAETIVPRIKHLHFLAAAATLSDKSSDRPVTMPFVADLVVAYSFDLPQIFQSVMQRDLTRLGMSVESLHERAIRNLMEHMPPIEYVGDPEEPSVLALKCGYDMEACMLLVPEYWNAASANLPNGKLVVAVPMRNLVLLTSSASMSGLEVLREVIRQASLVEDRTHNLSKSLLVWGEGRWTEFGNPARS